MSYFLTRSQKHLGGVSVSVVKCIVPEDRMGGSYVDKTRRKLGSCGSLLICHCPALEEKVGTHWDKMSSFSEDVDLCELLATHQ